MSNEPESMLSGVGIWLIALSGALTFLLEVSDSFSLPFLEAPFSESAFVPLFSFDVDARLALIRATFALEASSAAMSRAICLADFSPVLRPRYPTQFGAPHLHSTRAPPSAIPNASKL